MASLKNARSAVDDMVSLLKKDKKAGIVIQRAQELDNGFAQIVATVIHANGSKTNKAAVSEALREKLDNRLFPVENSFDVLSSNPVSDTIIGICSVNPQAVAYSENMQGFRILAGNMFMDEEESLWALRKTEAGEILVKSFGKDDAEIVSGILESVSCSDFTGSYESRSALEHVRTMHDRAEGGDFISYVNPNNGKVSFGAIVASVTNEDGSDTGKLYVADINGDPAQFVKRGMVLCSWTNLDIPEISTDNEFASAEANAKSPEEIASYYQKMFARSPEYFAKFMELWNNTSFM